MDKPSKAISNNFIAHIAPTSEFLETADFPDQVFKFRDWSVAYHRELLEGRLYFSSPEQFNDPFDCKIPIAYQLLQGNSKLQQEYFSQVVERHRSYLSREEKAIEAKRLIEEGRFNNEDWLNRADEAHRQHYATHGVFCFSRIKTDILLWSHYSNSHKGICIGFDAKTLFKEMLTKYNIGGADVKYVEDYPLISPTSPTEEQFVMQVSYKSAKWEYEKEIRLLKSLIAGKIFEIPLTLICEITLGCNISKEHKGEIVDFVRVKLPHAKVYQAVLVRGKFMLDFQEIIF